jgi:hypothetical protein
MADISEVSPSRTMREAWVAAGADCLRLSSIYGRAIVMIRFHPRGPFES